MIIAILFGAVDVFSHRIARHGELFRNFVYGKFSCVQSVGSGTLMIHKVGLCAHFAEWSIEG